MLTVMKNNLRHILGVFLTISFLISAPIIIFYAMGYRISKNFFETGTPSVQITGGLRVRTGLPYDVYLNNQPLQASPLYKVGLPIGNILVRLSFPGFESWEKNLKIEESTVTLIDKALLFPEDPKFDFNNSLLNKVDHTFSSPRSSAIIFRQDRDLIYLDKSSSTPVLISELQPTEEIVDVIWNNNNQSGILITRFNEKDGFFLFDLSNTNPDVYVKPLQGVFPYSTSSQPVSLLEFNGTMLFFEQGGHIRSYDLALDALDSIILSNVDDALMYGSSIVYREEISNTLFTYDIQSKVTSKLALNYQHKLKKYFINAKDTIILNDNGTLQSFTLSTEEASPNTPSVLSGQLSEFSFNGSVQNFIMSVTDQKMLVFTPFEIAIVYLDDFQTYTTRNRGDIATLYASPSGQISDAKFLMLDAEHVLFIENSFLKVVELDDRDTPQVYTFGEKITFFDWETERSQINIKVVQNNIFGTMKIPFRRLIPLL